MNTIYVIVKVHYDWYRFEENLAATTNEEQAIKLAQEHGTGMLIERGETTYKHDHTEQAHIWIQEFPI